MYPVKKLQDCAAIIAGQSPESKYYNTVGDGIPFFQGKADFGELYPNARVYCTNPTKIAQHNDILLSVRAPVGPTNLSPGKVCIGRGLAAIRPDSSLNLKYLLYYFRYFESQLSSKGTGTTFKAITQKTIKNLDVPAPPMEEQVKIVSRIDELFSELDKAVGTLKTTKEQLAVYRQVILVDAFKEALGSPYFEIEQMCDKIVDCPHSTPKWTEYGELCLRTTNFKRGYLDLQVPNYVSKEAFDERNRRITPSPGDVLYSREGSILGIACIIPEGINPCLGQRMMLLRTKDTLNNRYLMHYLNSPTVTNHVIATKGGTGSPHINVGDIKAFPIPVPEIDIQEKIVNDLEEKLSVCDDVEKTVDAALAQADAMRQSILKQAFEEGIV